MDMEEHGNGFAWPREASVYQVRKRWLNFMMNSERSANSTAVRDENKDVALNLSW